MKLIAVLGIAVLLLVLAGGCASGKRTVTTVETIECPPADEAGDPAPESECRTVREETVISNERVGGCSGILSCTFRAVGAVIALPFQILGAVLGAIF
jgi:hypothetical protein